MIRRIGNYTVFQRTEGNQTLRFICRGPVDSLDERGIQRAALRNGGRVILVTRDEMTTIFRRGIVAPGGVQGVSV